MADKSKKNFEFRMSKKVAELTQVVHMLFTRNHEKEVEIDALKEAYEDEIKLIIQDAKKKITVLEGRVQELERKLERTKTTHVEEVKTAVQQETYNRDEEWRKKVLAAEKALAEEKMETQHLRDLLINAQKDIEKLRQKVEDQLQSKSDEIQRRDRDIEALRKDKFQLERTLKESERQSSETIRNLEKNNQKLEKDFLELQAFLEDTHKLKEQLSARNKLLENELKTLKKEFQRRISDAMNLHQNHQQQPLQQSKTPRSAPSLAYNNPNEELERLRREVQRYRLELSNRDHNFNRMFSDQTALIVDPKTSKPGSSPTPMIPPSTKVSALAIPPGPNRDKSFSYAVNLMQSYEETKRPNSRVSSASGSKLPVLTPEQKARLTKLMKPRPLPKELLSSK